jgi:hypothetical protein
MCPLLEQLEQGGRFEPAFGRESGAHIRLVLVRLEELMGNKVEVLQIA